MPHIICVGAVYMDTILSVPHFPIEDTKLRATNLLRRRGGNTGNTLEVISQLLPADNFNRKTSTYTTELSLLTVLPDQASPDTNAVISSLPDVSTRLFQYRPGEQVAASSYIIQSARNSTRTIVSSNPLKEMTVDEFKAAIEPLITDDTGKGDVWIHFEGRVPEVLSPCLRWLRQKYGYYGKVSVSIELEKPDRVDLKAVATMADVVFYSKIWAEAHCDSMTGIFPTDANTFLTSQLPNFHSLATLICTWGSSGVECLRKCPNGEPITVTTSGWRPPPRPGHDINPVDTIGAGDTFIAGMIYACVHQKEWGITERIQFANELAGRKVYQQGFEGLGEEIKQYEVWGERMKDVVPPRDQGQNPTEV